MKTQLISVILLHITSCLAEEFCREHSLLQVNSIHSTLVPVNTEETHALVSSEVLKVNHPELHSSGHLPTAVQNATYKKAPGLPKVFVARDYRASHKNGHLAFTKKNAPAEIGGISTLIALGLAVILVLGISTSKDIASSGAVRVTSSWTGMRSILALLIFFEHMHSHFRPSCSAFLVLSGAILTSGDSSTIRRPSDYVRYLSKRCFRLLPALVAAQAFRLSNLTINGEAVSFSNLKELYQIDPMFFFDYEAWEIEDHETLWFIPAVAFLYTICPIINMMLASCGTQRSASRCVLVGFLCYTMKLVLEACVITSWGLHANAASSLMILNHPIAYVPEFMLGILVSHALKAMASDREASGTNQELTSLNFVGGVTDIAAVAFIGSMWTTASLPVDTILPAATFHIVSSVSLWTLFFALLLLSLGHPRVQCWSKSFLSSSVILQIGQASYGIYLYGLFFQKQFGCLAAPGIGCSTSSYVELSTNVTLMAFVSYHFVEEPSQRFIRWVLSDDKRSEEPSDPIAREPKRWNMTWSQFKEQALHQVEAPKETNFFHQMNRTFEQNSRRISAWFVLMFTVLVFPSALYRFGIGRDQILLLLRYGRHEAEGWSEERHHFRVMMKVAATVFVTFINVVKNYAAPWPEKSQELEHQNDPSYLARIGCLIPCHQSADEVVETVKSLLVFLKPEHIIVVDNGNSPTQLDDTQERLKKLNPDVVYMWVPLGLKSNALWKGLSKLPSTVEFVMHIDDDTILPSTFVFDESVWNHEGTSAISYGIVMNPTGIVERLVDFEFKLISQQRLFDSKFSTVWFQHGIIGLWRRKAFEETMQEHPFLPFGEDNWNGTINLLKNRQMRQELRSYVSTYAPSVLFPGFGCRTQGYGAANIWKQRADRWCVNAPRRFFIRLWLFFSYRHDTLMGNIVFRLDTLSHLSGIILHLTLPFMILYSVIYGEMLWQVTWYCLLPLSVLVHSVLQNYVFWRHREDVQVDFLTVLLYPLYVCFLLLCTCYGHWRCLLWYVPYVAPRNRLYTEDLLTPELVKSIHGINLLPDSKTSGLLEDDKKLIQG